ncbi:MAG: hypothetical protein COU63_04850 [Candidatus Pacebacteria bacterium CG10_big_fil_rev_8_21_14_0_10_36_11]|nr:hypothetical protein [Candidatus Pacearchaeota archaeon]OIP73968.1 MAG: hypothetical protein AUK08_01765 [Candidatus Pacebacteria bacterium CG2_30_36_39]PIR64393.1 MAG: hypothetical protein COU63_04850 [Candidatus Pacebacteria bacterium CG10_big_fil_rev_8_21_14_0_10_36_11]PJC42784.1 MAG: hypothetical protein CO040_02615 [Candidatus Pacebacteria bacterium CG_4_9_14_0_2_um_filter_36_8]
MNDEMNTKPTMESFARGLQLAVTAKDENPVERKPGDETPITVTDITAEVDGASAEQLQKWAEEINAAAMAKNVSPKVVLADALGLARGFDSTPVSATTLRADKLPEPVEQT